MSDEMTTMYASSKTISEDKQRELLIRTRVRTTKTFPFLSDLIYSREIILTDGMESFTDGQKIVLSLTIPQKMPEIERIWLDFACLHETMHLVFQHMRRFKALQGHDAEHILYNFLTDQVINEMVLKEMEERHLCTQEEKNFIRNEFVSSASIEKFLDKILVKEWKDKVIKPRGYSGFDYNKVDHAFAVLKPYLRKDLTIAKYIIVCGGAGSGKGSGNGNGGLMEGVGKMGKGKGQSPEEAEATEKDIQRKVLGGIIGGTMRGTGKGQLEQMIEEMWSKPRVSWKKILVNHIKTKLRGSRTWHTFHKKTYCSNVLIPGFNNKIKYRLAVAVDVSGSISDKQIHSFLTEIYWLMHKHKADVEYMTFDDGIRTMFQLHKISDINKCRKIVGRGGTSYEEVLEHAQRARSKDLVIVTDGYGDQDSIKTPRGMRVWWIVDNEETKFPFGKVIRVKSYGDD